MLVWELTEACDLECDHCRADAQPQRHPDELRTAELEAAFGLQTTEASHYRSGRRELGRESGGGRRADIVAGHGFASVSHVGEFYPSGFLPESVGNVREDDLVDRYRNAPVFETLRDRDRLTGTCGDCRYRAVCGGSRSRDDAYAGDPLASESALCVRAPDDDGAMPVQKFGKSRPAR